MKQKFIIQDWAGNNRFTDHVFNSYEEAWDFLYAQFPVIDGDDREQELGEYYVIEKTN